MAVPQENPTQYGAPLKYDPKFKGPLGRRSCTDVLCLLILIVFLIVWLVIAAYAYRYGNPNQLVSTVDSMGRSCGVDSAVVDKPYLFYFDITQCASPRILLNGCTTPQVCVSQCPSYSWTSLPYRQRLIPFDANKERSNLICQDEAIKATVTDAFQLNSVIKNQQCVDWYINTQPVFGRCLPIYSNATEPLLEMDILVGFFEETMKSIVNWAGKWLHSGTPELGNEMMEDLRNTWQYMLVAAAVAVLISLVYITLLRWLAGVITWITLLGIIALLAALSVFSYFRYDDLKNSYSIRTKSTMIQGTVEGILNDSSFWMFILVLSSVVGVITLLIIIFLRKRIVIAIALIKEGSKAVGSVMSTLILPIVPWIFQLGIVAFAVTLGVYLSSIGNPLFRIAGLSGSNCECQGEYSTKQDGDICEPGQFNQLCHGPGSGDFLSSPCQIAGCYYIGNSASNLIIYMHLANVFGAFWLLWFISGIFQMILAGTFATYYWTFQKSKMPFFVVTKSTFRTMRYHLGTVAFGSLILAICSMIRAFIEYTQQKLKKYNNSFVNGLLCCCRCFFWCLEKFLKFINRNAYIMCAIHGKNFCTSAQDAFNLLMRNALRMAVLDKVTDFLFFIGKLVVTGIVVAAFYFVFQDPKIHLHNTWFPLVIIGLFTFVICSIFFGVYTMAVNTLMLCFLEDCERNDGSAERPYYMSKNLMKILGKKNIKLQRTR